MLPRLGKNGNVSFIFDTGADTSLLMPLDGQRMGIDYGRFQKEGTSLGIGGTSENYIESAYLAFVGDEALYGYEIELRVTYDKSALELLAEVISSDAQQELED